MTSWIIPWGNGALGTSFTWDVPRPHEGESCGIVSWAQHVAYFSSVFVDVLIVGKCIFLKPWTKHI